MLKKLNQVNYDFMLDLIMYIQQQYNILLIHNFHHTSVDV